MDSDLKDSAFDGEPASEQLPASDSVSSVESLVVAAGSDVAQSIPCVLVFTLAFQSCPDWRRAYTTSSMERSKKFSMAERISSKARRYYHIEYFLLPDDDEPKKVDMVVFPSLTKVFTDSGVKTVKPWLEGDKYWVTWTQTFNMEVTKDLLKKINSHRITLKVWDSKDKVSRKVRYYRLKASGYTEDLSAFEVKHLVVHQRRLSEQSTYSKEDWNQDFIVSKAGKARRAKGSYSHDPDNMSIIPEEFERLVRVEGNSPEPRWSSRRTLPSLVGSLAQELRELLEKSSFESIRDTTEKIRLGVKQGDSTATKRKASRRAKKMSKEEESEIKLVTTSFAPDFLVIQLPLTPLLAGWKMVMSRGCGRSPNILDCFLTLKTDKLVMSEQQRQELNPMTIKIDRVSRLPSAPVPLRELERLCMPVYCKYQFPGTPLHVTEGHPHSTCVRFQDVNVILLGDMHPGDLREFLDGPPLVVEIHDRDRKPENTTQKPALFGEEPLDTYSNIHAFASPRDAEFSPFESQNKTWDPYGVARVSFADLLLGHKYLNLSVPVHNCEPQPTNPNKKRRKRALDDIQPLPMGNYLEAHTHFKLRVDIAVPLTQAGPKTPEPDLSGPPFGRIIFVFGSRKHILLRPLLRDLTIINTRALSPDTFPLGSIKQVLPAIKVRMDIGDRPDLDVITGLHLLDGQLHLLILEGLASRALKRLWENYQSRIPMMQSRPCAPYKVLYNSQLLFRHRLYGGLESAVYHLRLFQPLAQLVRLPKLYLRDTVPRPVFQALTRLYDICHWNTRLREVVTRDLLPSAAMVRALSQQFGLPISQEEFLEGEGLATLSPPRSPPPQLPLHPRISLCQDIEQHQERYLQWRDSTTQQGHSFVQSLWTRAGPQSSLGGCGRVTLPFQARGRSPDRASLQNNILSASQAAKKPVPRVKEAVQLPTPAGGTVFNYSSQALNSSALARKKLQLDMAREPWKRFTYSQKYLWATLDYCDPEGARAAEQASRRAWLTAEGFRLTGLQETNYLFPLRLGAAFTEEWQEGALFRNVLENVLDRERWPWERRHQDFELYKKPPTFLQLPPVPKRKLVPDRTLKGSS